MRRGGHAPLADLAARCAPPLAAGALLALLAVVQADRAAAAETAYLALWIAAVLLPVAALAPAPARELTLGAPLAALAVWALPAGPGRAAAVGALLVGAFAVAAVRAAAVRGRAGENRRAARAAPGWGAAALPLALGAQFLLRGDLLLAPGAVEVATLVVLPAVGALVLARLAERWGPAAALLAGAGGLALGPGWTAVTTLALVGVAAGAETGAWAARFGAGSESAAGIAPSGGIAGTEPAGDPVEAGGRRRRPRGARLRAVTEWLPLLALGAVLAVGLATETRAAAAALLGGAIVAFLDFRHRPGVGHLATSALLLLAGGLLAAAAVAPLRPWSEALARASWVPILLPALIWLPAAPAARWVPGAAAAALAAVGALAVPGPAGVAAAVAVSAVLLARGPRDRARAPAPAAALEAQGLWSAALLAGTALLAAYPWLRPSPAADALARIGLAPGWRAALTLAAVALMIGLAARVGGRDGRRTRLVRPAMWAAGLLAVALFAALPAPAAVPFGGPAAVLGPERPRLSIELPGPAVGTVALYTHLSNGAGLAAGTEVAAVRLIDVDAETPAAWTLTAGAGTGEWAARRADVAARPGLAAPAPWTGWIEGGSGAGGPFFGQLYRRVLTTESAVPATSLLIERDPELPPEVMLSVRRVEVGR